MFLLDLKNNRNWCLHPGCETFLITKGLLIHPECQTPEKTKISVISTLLSVFSLESTDPV